jgi:uncharacterized protein
MQQIFVDTAAWLALEVTNDQYYEAAQAFGRGQGREYRWVTTNWVLWEAVTGLVHKATHAAAVRFGERLRASGRLDIVTVGETHEEAAWRLFKRYSDKDMGFIDCTSFAVMQSLGIQAAFTFDTHFRQAGFTVLPTLR